MKLLPIILIAVGSLLFIIGIVGIFIFIDLACDSPEDIENMKRGDELSVHGKILFAPTSGLYDPHGLKDDLTWSWKLYNYTFEDGEHFHSRKPADELGIETGETYVIDLEYTNVAPQGARLVDDEESSVGGTFLYRLPGIGLIIVGIFVIGAGLFIILLDKKKESSQLQERKRKKDAIDKQMELLEKEIEMALHTGGGAPPGQLQYQSPQAHPGPGQAPIGHMPPGGMPPGGMPPGAAGMPPRGPPAGQPQQQVNVNINVPPGGQQPPNRPPQY